ncbi:MAG: hypothetical protein K6T88_22095 [Bacillus sp. (in: Bacteria)]|nr:hypothetical protein [Bacillus sp. (in: firmicutes)]
MKYLLNEGIEIWSITEGLISSFSERETVYYLQCSKEVEKTSQRVKRRCVQLNEEGTFTRGSPPFGYQIIKVEDKSELAIHPQEAEVVTKWVMENDSRLVNIQIKSKSDRKIWIN